MADRHYISKEAVKDKIESFIYSKLAFGEYPVVTINAAQLLSANRFDLGLKLAFLSYKDVLPELAFEIYKNDIRAQTLGNFKEYGNEEKSSLDVYLDHFRRTFDDIKKNGFDECRTLVPLSASGCILNGAHRVASAIFLNENVTCFESELDRISPNYQYFFARNVPEEVLDIGALSFADYAQNTYLAFLWPSGRKNFVEAESLFPNIVYKKNVTLNPTGALNLLVELYKHMDWVGTKESNFHGAQQKLVECFPDFSEFKVILFQCETLNKVQDIKKQIRNINKIGFSSVHITDTKEEVNRISRLIFNKNGLHFLNFARPYRFDSSIKMVESLYPLGEALLRELVVDGGMTLSIYGLRQASDIDYFSRNVIRGFKNVYEIEPHDSQLEYHQIAKDELIYNPKYNFEYLGIKFVSFSQMYRFKKNRNDEKDRNDFQIMQSLMEKRSVLFLYSKCKQNIFYRKIIIKRRFRVFVVSALRMLGIYGVIRAAYRSFKGRI